MNLLGRLGLAAGRDLVLGSLLERTADLHGTRRLVTQDALPGPERPSERGAGPALELTHLQAATQVATWSGAIAARITPGDRVVVALANGYEVLLASLAVCRAGGVAVPVNPRMSRDEIDHVVEDSGADVVLRSVDELDVESVRRPAVAADVGDVAAIFYTSGTTGRPKGARLTHRSLLGSVGAGTLLPTGLRTDEAVLGLPVAHIMGFAALLGLAAAGVPAYFLPSFEATAVLDAIERRRSSVFVGVPAMYRMLLEAGAESRDLRSVRLWASGADVMPPGLARRFQRMGATVTLPLIGRSVGEAAFVEGYGMVELGGGAIARVAPPGFSLPFGDAVGLPLPGYRVKVVDDAGRTVLPGVVGELLVKGRGVLEGYHDDPEATAAALTPDGWLRTGDLARKGPLGSVMFAGRKKDVVKVGGYSVFAVEVERALEEHADVLEAAVVGLPDDRLGETPAAVVRLRPGAITSEADLVAYAGEVLASYQVPRRIVVVDELPRTGTTKVQKAELLPLFD